MIQSFKYITCLLLCFLVSAISFADEIEVNGIKYEVIKKAKVAILLDAYNCKSSDVNIPSSVTYEELTESEKEYDCNTSQETLKLIMKLGFKIVKE